MVVNNSVLSQLLVTTKVQCRDITFLVTGVSWDILDVAKLNKYRLVQYYNSTT